MTAWYVTQVVCVHFNAICNKAYTIKHCHLAVPQVLFKSAIFVIYRAKNLTKEWYHIILPPYYYSLTYSTF